MKVIILAGGSGARLWPLSRESQPKQFVKIQGKRLSLFQEAFERSLLLCSLYDVYIVTNKKLKDLVISDISELGYLHIEENIIVEPEAKNTLPAIYAGVHKIIEKEHDTVIVFPSDHMIMKKDEFILVIRESEALCPNSLITFGIQPDSPNEGYGYISPAEKMLNGFVVDSFKEKPSFEKACEYIEKGYYWNAGIFMFNTNTFMNEVKTYRPDIYQAFDTSTSLDEAFSKITSKISIDYGVMEKSSKVVVVPVDIGWNDLGSFDAFYEVFQVEEGSNITNEENIILDSRNVIIHTRERKIVAAVGVEDLIIIDDDDALLVCKKNQSQKVKKVVDILKERNDHRTDHGIKIYQPWGTSTCVEEIKDKHRVQRITLNKEKKFSYMLNDTIQEYWIILNGFAKVAIDGEEKHMQVGDNVLFKQGRALEIENTADLLLEIVVLQVKILGEGLDSREMQDHSAGFKDF